METIEIKDSTRRDITGAVIMGTIFVIGVALAMSDRAMPGLGTFWMLFSSLIGSPFIYRLVNKRPRILIEPDGITDMTSKVGRIAWDDIYSIKIVSLNNGPNICVRLRDPEKYHRNLFVLKRGLSQVDNVFSTGDMTLNCMGVDKSPVEIVHLMSEYQDNFFLEKMGTLNHTY
jgi:hypothetical protein